MTQLPMTRAALSERCLLNNEHFFSKLSEDYLAFFGIQTPTMKQKKEMHGLLAHVWLRRTIYLDSRLTEREKQCLYLSAQGKTIAEIAKILSIHSRRIEKHRESICKKLGCKNIVEAVFVGVRFGINQTENPF